jgi:hypothetical protein
MRYRIGADAQRNRYQDYLNSIRYPESKVYVMAGGIKGWMAKYKGHDDLVDYD